MPGFESAISAAQQTTQTELANIEERLTKLILGLMSRGRPSPDHTGLGNAAGRIDPVDPVVSTGTPEDSSSNTLTMTIPLNFENVIMELPVIKFICVGQVRTDVLPG